MVPTEWYANRAWGTTPACRDVADAPFDVPFDGESVSAPILIAVRDVEASEGATRVGEPVTIETADRFATRYVVNGARRLVDFVVPLIATADGAPQFLHLEALEADGPAVAALEAIVARLSVWEPLTPPATAQAEASQLFDEGRASPCLDLERGLLISVPTSWFTNVPTDVVSGCAYIAPAPFDLVAGTTEVPDGVSITITVLDGDVGSVSEDIVGYDSIVVDGRPASRVGWSAGSYWTVVQLGPISEVGPNVLLATGADPVDRAVLDRIAGSIRISRLPDEVARRTALPSCGVEVDLDLGSDGGRNEDARGCFAAAYSADEPAELVTVGTTIEGGSTLTIYRVVGAGEYELIHDATHDPGGGGLWQVYRCSSLGLSAGGIGLGACDHPITYPAP